MKDVLFATTTLAFAAAVDRYSDAVARRSPPPHRIVELATVHTPDEANALLAIGWEYVGLSFGGVGMPATYHLGRPANVSENGR